MKKAFRCAAALFVCAALLFTLHVPCLALGSSEKITACGEDCAFYPTIIIPGLGQSNVMVTDDNGEFLLDKNGAKISAFPAYLDVGSMIRIAVFPLLASILTQKDVGLSAAFGKIIDTSFGINTSDNNGQNTGNVKTERYLYPYSEFNDYEVESVNHHVPFELYPTELPKDHLYYFAYNSFGNHIDLVDELYEFIQMVKAQTGHDKVNLVPLSQGSTFVSAMLEYYPQVADELHKIFFVVPALNGSIIIGDVFNDRVNFLNRDYLYNGFFDELGLLDEFTARLIEIALRILPDEVVMKTVQNGVKHLVEGVMTKSTAMWTLCPPEDYPSAAQKYLSSPERANIKAQTDKYYQVQLHHRDNIQKLVDHGVQVFDVVEYNWPVINVCERWNTMNGDYIIHTTSTSMGATFANVGETLPEGYVQQNTHCTDPTHNHISPERIVDASTGLLPDTTFYFNGNRHDLTQHNDVILKLAMKMIADDEIRDVYSSPDFPQFLFGRNVSELLPLMKTAKELDRSGLSEQDKKLLDDALTKAQSTLDNNLASGDDLKACEAELRAILVKLGAAEAVPAPKDPTVLRSISLFLYDHFGTNGFSELPALTIKLIFQKIVSFFKG